MNTDKPCDAIMGALAFFYPAHPTRGELVERALLADPRITNRQLHKALTSLLITGKIVAYECSDSCLHKKA